MKHSELYEMLHPHRPLQDLEWPTPRNYTEARAIIEKTSTLPLEQQVIIMLTAIETAIESCQDRLDKEPVPQLKEIFSPYIRQAYEWLDGKTDETELEKLRKSLITKYNKRIPGLPTDSSAKKLFLATQDMLAHIIRQKIEISTIGDPYRNAFMYAQDAPSFVDGGKYKQDTEFHSKWWNKTMCRLAFKDATTAQIERR